MGLVFGLCWNALGECAEVAPFAEMGGSSVAVVVGETAEAEIFEDVVVGMTEGIADHEPHVDCSPPFVVDLKHAFAESPDS